MYKYGMRINYSVVLVSTLGAENGDNVTSDGRGTAAAYICWLMWRGSASGCTRARVVCTVCRCVGF